jgi:hypothetical protein
MLFFKLILFKIAIELKYQQSVSSRRNMDYIFATPISNFNHKRKWKMLANPNLIILHSISWGLPFQPFIYTRVPKSFKTILIVNLFNSITKKKVIEKSQHESLNLCFPIIGTTFTKYYTLLTCTLDKFGWKNSTWISWTITNFLSQHVKYINCKHG